MQRLAEICVRRPVLAGVITLVMVVVGAISFFGLNVERYPNLDLPIIVVLTKLPGASPEEMETDITRKIEDAVSGVGGIDQVTSTSAEGFSTVVAQFVLNKNVNVAAQEVQEKVSGVVNDLPAGTDPPTVLRYDPNQIPVLVVALSAPRSVRDISEYADKVVRPQLEGVPGVAAVRLTGDQLRQINVLINPYSLAAYGITATNVLNAINAQNVQVPAGSVNYGTQRYTVRTLGRVDTPADLVDITIANRAGMPITLGDVARIEDGAAQTETVARVDGSPTVLLAVQKQAGANTVGVAETLKERLHDLEHDLAPGYRIRVVRDQSIYVLASTHAVEEHLVVGSLLAGAVVLAFLWNWRSTIITALAIPISLIGTFTLLAAMHLTLNEMTLLALALVIGIVIDDAIVVLENIYRFIHEKGMPAVPAAIEATREIGPAVMATTLSLIVVFLPLAFIGGIIGRFMTSFGWTMAFAIFVSLIVSFTLTPSLCSRWLAGASRRPHAEHKGPAHGWMERVYGGMLEWSLRRRLVIVGLCLVTLFSMVPLGAAVNQEFLPSDDESQFQVDVEAPASWTLDGSTALGTQLSAAIRRLPAVAYTLLTVGDDSQHSPNKFSVYVRLAPLGQRRLSQDGVMELVRTGVLPRYGYLHLVAQVNAISDMGGASAPVQYVISGPSLDVLTKASQAAVEYLRTLPGVTDARSSLAPGRPVLDVRVDRGRAADLGVSVSEAANNLAVLLQGLPAKQAKYAEGGRLYDIVVRAGGPFRADAAALSQIPVLSANGGTATLGQVVDVSETTGPSTIEHFNRRRQVTVSANLLPGTSLGGVIQQLNEKVRSLGLPPEYAVGVSGSSKSEAETGTSFLRAFGMAFVFMYLVLAAQFESWIHPITILLSLPLTVPFALLSILLLHGALNLLSYLGVLVLFGVVKKNAILQVDHANHLRAQGMARNEAIVVSSLDRLRPILMTTIAFVAGMLPLALSHGVGSATNHAISTVVIGGQMLSLLLTLVAIPVIYSLFDDLERMDIKNRVKRAAARLVAPATRRAPAAPVPGASVPEAQGER